MVQKLYYVCLVLAVLACKTNKSDQGSSILLNQKANIQFLDSLEAARFIIKDPMEGFFDKITSLDMQIQLQKSYPNSTDRKEILSDYRKFLAHDVTTFTNQEQELLSQVWQKVYRDCNSIRTGLFPDTISLLKTLAQHYGPGVYYTRGKGIIIPQNELYSENIDGLYTVMLHELFHIWSRLHPDKRQQLYSLIGFRKLPVVTSELEMNPTLRSRILLNPDGVDYSYTIQLINTAGHLVDAIPIIISNRKTYSADQPSFFSYLSFQLFPIEKTPLDTYKVISTAEGLAPSDLIEGSNFTGIIKDNTSYIIHPDEIMADNFVLWVKQNRKDQAEDLSLSEEGGKLLERLNHVMMQ